MSAERWKVYRHGARSGDGIALTFDDGPNGPATLQVLEILRAYNIKATFFQIAANVEYFSEVSQKVVKEGHDIGNHSYYHSFLLALKGTKAIIKELEKAQGVISEITGVKPVFFRPPYGFRSPWLVKAAKQLGLSLIMWDNMTDDWHPSKSAIEITRAILKKARRGSIIVLHDGRGRRHGFDRSQMILALPQIIEGLKERGFEFISISELVETSR